MNVFGLGNVIRGETRTSTLNGLHTQLMVKSMKKHEQLARLNFDDKFLSSIPKPLAPYTCTTITNDGLIRNSGLAIRNFLLC
jgi:hypothetical protein